MDDDVHKSSESLPTSEEYEIIGNFEPELHIVGNGNEDQLKLSMQEVLSDLDENVQDKADDKTYLETDASSLSTDQSPQHCNTDNNQKNMSIREDYSIVSSEAAGKDASISESLKAAMYTPSPSSVDEDLMSMSMSLVEGDYTVFDRIVYLGCAMIADPMSEIEIRRNMAVLNGQTSAKAMHISLSLPVHSEGYVVLYEPSSSYEIVNFPLHQIKTYVPGSAESKEANCIALVYESNQSHLSETIIYQCHVFRCEVPEAATKILQCLSSASKKQPKMSVSRSESFETDKSDSIAPSVKTNEQTYIFEAVVEFKEDDAKGNCVSCPMDKDYFKFKCKLKKNVTVKVQQISDNKELAVDRCFGLLISPGRNVRNSDMQLIEMVSFKKFLGEKSFYSVLGSWDPNESVFTVLNKETPKDTRVYMTVAVDLVIAGIQEPVRFSVETKAKILPQNERFWNFTKKSSLHEKFYLRLREVDADGSGDCLYHVVSLHSLTQLQRKKESMHINLSQSAQKSSQPSPASPAEPDSESDNDEPLLSGSGEVSKDCTETELEGWAQVLSKWRQNLDQRPKSLTPLVRRGIPEALRGEVWQLLAGCHDDNEIFEAYKTLINKSSPSESIIQRDINRTFPAHEQFKEKDGVGQDALFKICKAYAVYDPEVGYCQGLSFLVAALLLHMPEEQAFAVLVKIMFDYHVRDMFRNGFDELHLKFYQLQKLMEEHLPELYAHFEDLGIEVHMFASQWFLTLFTAKFPLVVVFFIIDLFLLDAMEMIFRVAIALLTLSKKDLLALDFEGVLKHFRVSLPKKYRTEEAARQLMKLAVKVKVKGLKKSQKEYLAFKEQEKFREDPIQCLQRENKRLLENNMRLEQENEDLSRELNNMKLRLRGELHKVEEKCEALSQDLQTTQLALSEVEDEKKRLSTEVAQLKEMCRRELQRAESENTRNSTIIAEYKQICSQLSLRLEKEQASAKRNLEILKAKLDTCTQCSKFIDDLVPRLASASIKKISEKDKDSQIREAESQARELELELAQTKLDLVEAQCKNQDLTHQLNSAINELQSSKNTWFHKTLLSIRDAAKKDNPSARDTKDKDVS